MAQDLLLRELLQQRAFRLTAFTLEERLFAMTERSLRLSEALGNWRVVEGHPDAQQHRSEASVPAYFRLVL